MPTCDHCLIEFSESRSVEANINAERRVFCCHACLGVYELIHTEHLDDFYKRRREWTPGPATRVKADPALFTPGVRQAGEDFEIDLQVGGIRCASCVWLTEKILARTPGVVEARVNYANHRATVRWSPSVVSLGNLLDRISDVGYQPRPFEHTAEARFMQEEQKRMLVRLGTALFLSMQLMVYSVALYAGYFQGIAPEYRRLFHIVALVLATPVMFYSGWPFLTGALTGPPDRSAASAGDISMGRRTGRLFPCSNGSPTGLGGWLCSRRRKHGISFALRSNMMIISSGKTDLEVLILLH